jgi:predicted RNase H-like nuclease (RuvC/YqgF family)
LVQKKHLIVGVDPGTTTGIAILDLEGNLLRIHSSRTMSLKDLIHMIIGYGYPVVVATDVTPTPAFVDRVGRLFEAVVHQPAHSLTVDEKRDLAKSYAAKFGTEPNFRNTHEKDAFAAAAKALESYGDKFRWIDRRLEERGLDAISERVKTMVVGGQSLSDSVAEVLSEREPKPERPPPKPPISEESTASPEKLKSLHRIESSMIKNLEKEILDLKTQLRDRELKIKSLGNELERYQSESFWKMLRSKEIDSRNSIIADLKRSLSRVAADRNRLRKKLDSLSESSIWKVVDRLEPIAVVGDLAKNTLAEASTKWEAGSASRIVMVEDPSGAGSTVADRLGQMGVEAIITGGEMPGPARESLENRGIPIIPRDKAELIVLGGMALGDRAKLDRLLASQKKALERKAVAAATTELKRYLEDYRKKITSQE